MSGLDRRGFLKLAAAGALGAGLTACGGGSEGGAGGLSLRYAWWGNNIRQQNYMKALKEFTTQNKDIQVEPEFAEYSAFQERMTTQMAARDVADIFWIASPQVLTYHKSKLYRRLDDIPTLDLSGYSKADLDSFKLGGELNTMPFGIFVPVIRYNETWAKEDGVELPAVDTDWDAWAAFLVDYTRNNPGKRKGMAYEPDADLPFESWLRQRGEQLWTEDGRAGFTVDSTRAWFDWWDKLLKAGAVLTLSEQEGMSPDWALVGKKVLAKVGNSNHIIDDAKMFPDQRFKLRPTPVAAGAQAGHPFLYFPRMAIYQGIDDEKVQAAGKLVNYNTNNVAMLKTVGLTMGAPVNPKVFEQSKDFAGQDEKEMLAVVQAAREAERKPRFEAPPGTSTWRTAMARVAEEIALGRVNTADGSKRFLDEVQAGIERTRK
ncbi:ABC transporter substrate-binding protein [Nonomuraea jiangxiensis]|uniref:ABC-type glycerol-3-phosphate transport system, substrate-binding protein n=2 Tax=Nonomuraea TaxID=83681 RepID=A0A1G9KKK2_9ACTN|nr:ABC transporter substrate-binding protein [Nonomuraea jiangxiensis]SDL50189.1 ABC-type glycerol-3-phosphate transport system, substrate-binding protein [Nonomuraea jiangxiensis]